jgi:hypothetical protein
MYTSVRLCWVALAALIDLPRVRHRGVARAAPRHVLGAVLRTARGDVAAARAVLRVVKCRFHRGVAHVTPALDTRAVAVALLAADRAALFVHAVSE